MILKIIRDWMNKDTMVVQTTVGIKRVSSLRCVGVDENGLVDCWAVAPTIASRAVSFVTSVSNKARQRVVRAVDDFRGMEVDDQGRCATEAAVAERARRKHHATYADN